MRELMFTTTGRSCFTSGASEGMGPTCFTASAVFGADEAACASAASSELSPAPRWQAETSGRATTAASAPEQSATRTVKRRCMKPPRERSPERTAVAPVYFDARARKIFRARRDQPNRHGGGVKLV